MTFHESEPERRLTLSDERERENQSEEGTIKKRNLGDQTLVVKSHGGLKLVIGIDLRQRGAHDDQPRGVSLGFDQPRGVSFGFSIDSRFPVL